MAREDYYQRRPNGPVPPLVAASSAPSRLPVISIVFGGASAAQPRSNCARASRGASAPESSSAAAVRPLAVAAWHDQPLVEHAAQRARPGAARAGRARRVPQLGQTRSTAPRAPPADDAREHQPPGLGGGQRELHGLGVAQLADA